MKSPLFLLLAMILLTTTDQVHAQKSTWGDSNPFAASSKLLYQAPQFDKIKDSDYKPALEEGLKQRLTEIEIIANNPAKPTFENTLVALEKSGQLLTRVNNVLNVVSSANTNDFLQKLQEEMAPEIAANTDAVFLNSKLFSRVEIIFKLSNTLKLDTESKRLLEVTYQEFVLSGAKLSDPDKIKLRELNKEEALLGARFSNQLVNGAKAAAFVIKQESDLAGLSAAEKANFAKNATEKGLPGQWVIPLANTTQQPALKSLSNRNVRQRLFETSWNRAERGDSTDTRSIIIRLAQLRAERAKLIGFPNYATLKLIDQMAKTPQAVDDFLSRLTPLLKAKTKEESMEIQAAIDKQNGGFKLEAWDWDYYSEQVRKEKYDLNEAEVKPYFEINKVLEDGVFYAASQLYGLTFKERSDIPVYQPDVRVFEVFDQDGKSFALFYGDYFKRDNKSGGAWMTNLVDQTHLLGTNPVIVNVCNFTKPVSGEAGLISFDDVRTMFHEFGHALHGLFADQKYISLSGTNTARDFVEFPSQINEHWALDAKILPHYAVHYKTGETIPQALVDKIKKASNFNAGYGLTEAVQASLLDMGWHKQLPGASVPDVDTFELATLKSTGLNLPQIPPRYRSSYFLHIWGNGYAAGYYAYQWTKMLSEDAYSWFEQNGGLSRANGDRFRKLVLSKGNSEDYATMFKNFRGHDPDAKSLEKGLAPDK